MADLPPHGLPLIEEHDATGDVADIYDAFKRQMQAPFVPNMMKAIAVSESGLKMHMGMLASFYEHLTLPQALVSIICFSIAEKSNCTYCSSAHELTCRTLGVDEATLRTIADDLGAVNPERVRAIIEFSLKAAKYPQKLEPADYDAVRAHGITNDEIVEIIMVAGVAVYSDILADALKIEVEKEVTDALAQ